MPGASYQYRLKAVTSSGVTYYGATMTFNSAAFASVSTAAVGAITTTSAVLGGDVTADGGSAVTERGIVWGTVPNPITASFKSPNGSGTGVLPAATVNGMPPGFTIYARAYAINSAGTAYGNQISFATTAIGAPEIGIEQPVGVPLGGDCPATIKNSVGDN